MVTALTEAWRDRVHPAGGAASWAAGLLLTCAVRREILAPDPAGAAT